jgi:hypothetical protein
MLPPRRRGLLAACTFDTFDSLGIGAPNTSSTDTYASAEYDKRTAGKCYQMSRFEPKAQKTTILELVAFNDPAAMNPCQAPSPPAPGSTSTSAASGAGRSVASAATAALVSVAAFV